MHGAEPLGDGPGRGERAIEALGQNRAAVDGDQVMRARRREADFEDVWGAAPGMKHRAAAAVAVRVNEIGHRRFNAGLAQRLDDETVLPRAVRRVRPMLQRAAAANPEMRADRRDTLGAGFFDVEELPAVRMTGPIRDLDAFARQCARDVDRIVGIAG